MEEELVKAWSMFDWGAFWIGIWAATAGWSIWHEHKTARLKKVLFHRNHVVCKVLVENRDINDFLIIEENGSKIDIMEKRWKPEDKKPPNFPRKSK